MIVRVVQLRDAMDREGSIYLAKEKQGRRDIYPLQQQTSLATVVAIAAAGWWSLIGCLGLLQVNLNVAVHARRCSPSLMLQSKQKPAIHLRTLSLRVQHDEVHQFLMAEGNLICNRLKACSEPTEVRL